MRSTLPWAAASKETASGRAMVSVPVSVRTTVPPRCSSTGPDMGEAGNMAPGTDATATECPLAAASASASARNPWPRCSAVRLPIPSSQAAKTSCPLGANLSECHYDARSPELTQLEPKTFNGRRIEVQIRTQLQHSWATAVEAIGMVRGEDLKGGEGNMEWLRLFELMSSEFAEIESCPLVPGTPDQPARRDEISCLNQKLKAVKTLENLVSPSYAPSDGLLLAGMAQASEIA